VILEIANMRWTTANVARAKHTMLASDRPVIMTNGLVVPNAHIAIPLSPTVLFFAVKTEATRQEIFSMNKNQMVEVTNSRVVEQAVKYVYGVDDRHSRFVANRIGKMLPSSPIG
jgi:hypothetical protein